jgi:hypothetical protein
MTPFGARCLAFSGRPVTAYGERRGVSYLSLSDGDTEGKVMVLVAADPDGGSRLLIDVTVADPLRMAADSAVDRAWTACGAFS